MKQVLGSEAAGLFPLPNGFIIITKAFEDEIEKVSFKLISFDTYTMSTVSRKVFMLAKFGENYPAFEMQVEDPIFCKVALLPDGKVFTVMQDGRAKVMDENGYVTWQGTLKYNGQAANEIAVDGYDLWASFSDSNAIIYFNMRTMREELRIGGPNVKSSICKPEGLWLTPHNSMLVCNSGANNILEINLKDYTVSVYAEFNESVHKFIKVNSNELILLDSGVYKI
ncbi:MAG: hypothetical protein Q4B04_00995 [bacterium]|nr:hypothetical protein [bacterium]